MARPNQPGLHDPYWYEATYAECQIVEMLDPASDIESVTLQAPNIRSIDDVVVTYKGRPTACYQLKHSRSGDSISLATLMSASGTDASLLRQLAEGWAEETRNHRHCETHLVTNRPPTVRHSSNSDGVALPPIGEFWAWVQEAVTTAPSVAEIAPPAGWEAAWQVWLGELGSLSATEQLTFMQTLHIDLGGDDTAGLEAAILARLGGLYGIPEDTARRSLAQLDYKLREWATSQRGDAVAVTAERACEALAAGGSEVVGDHEFSPPAPFFGTRDVFVSTLAERIRARTKGVLFLTGSAGCGKSSVVSALANRAEPIVDLRFHAFRPLTPQLPAIPEDVGRAVTATALWGDLLAQLRTRFFQGRLWKHRVPIRNDFLLDKPGALKEHVLRLASALATERGRPTVIAIDGVDHAARARHLTPEVLTGRPALLSSLVAPDAVPDGVIFLVAGQPGWPQYPAWLRTPDSGVETIEVPAISVEDIEALVRGAAGPLPPPQVGAAARIIERLTHGNTLAAVYAALEAASISDILHLEAHLSSRRLGASLEEYYTAIWEGALKDTVSAKPSTGTQLAAALALSSARLTGDLLAGFYPASGYSAGDWEAILLKLEPIVEGGPKGYAIRHNDVRVFLMTQLGSERRLPVASASAIADHYLRAGATTARHADLFRVLAFAERSHEMPAVFSPEYVAQAVALRRPMAELEAQARLALNTVGVAAGWTSVHTLALGLATFHQARSVADYYQLSREMPNVPPCLVSEARVLAREHWTADSIEGVLSDAEALVTAGEHARAKAMCERWFSPLRPVELARDLEALEQQDPSRSHQAHERIDKILRRFGGLTQTLALSPDFPRPSKSEKEAARRYEASFFGGWLRAGVAASRPWKETLRKPWVWYHADVEWCLSELAGASRWSDILESLESLEKWRTKLAVAFLLRGAMWAIKASAPQKTLAKWVTPVADRGFGLLAEYREGPTLDELELYVSTAFVVGYMDPARPSGGVSEDGVTQYFSRHGDERLRGHVGRLLYAAAWTGKFLRGSRSRPADGVVLTQAQELAAVVQSLLSPDCDRPAFVPPGYMHHAAHLLELILDCITSADAHLEAELSEVLLANIEKQQAWPTLEVVWRALARRGHHVVLHALLRDWVGNGGRVWRLDLGERAEITRRFARLGREQGWEAEVGQAEERLQWNQLGYTGHKEYALSRPLEAFRTAAREEPELWETMGIRLLAISEEASAAGGNRLRSQVDQVLADAAARVGPAATWKLARAVAATRKNPFVLGDDIVFDGLVDALESLVVTASDALSIWCVGVGVLPWEHDSHQVLLADLRHALSHCAARCRVTATLDKMRALAPFEWSIGPDGGEHSGRWFAPDTSPKEDAYRKDLLKPLRSLPVDEAIRALTDGARANLRSRSSDLWRAIAECGKRLRTERTAGYAESLSLLKNALLLRSDPYSWAFDGFAAAVESIAPLLTDQECWEVCRWTVERAMGSDSIDIWLPAASDNLRLLVSLPSASASRNGRREILEREVGMHECWILGGRSETAERNLPMIRVPDDGDVVPSNWCALALHGLVELLKSRSAVRCRGAVRGLYALLVSQAEANDAGAVLWGGLDRRQRVLLLMMLERLSAEHPDRFAPWRIIVESCLANGEGEEQLQALITLQSFTRSTRGTEKWVLPRAEQHEHGDIVRVGSHLLDVPGDFMGTVGLARGQSSVRQLARMFAEVTGLEKEEIESLVADVLRNEITAVASPDGENFWSGDMMLSVGKGVAETIKYLVDETRAGCFGPISALAVAQALLSSDEPRVMTTSGAPGASLVEWPIDDELETLIVRGGAARDRLREVAEAGLAAGERLLGAEVMTYSRKHDAVLTMALGWARDPLGSAAQYRPGTFTGRGFIAYSGAGYEPLQAKEAGWFTLHAGGLGIFIHANVPLTPSRIWRAFGWNPSPENPLVWLREGNAVARIEVVRGPVRKVIQDALHRQPLMFRWVADCASVDAASQWLGSPLREYSDIEVRAVRDA